MLPSLALGLLLLAAFIIVTRWFSTASPGNLARAATWTGAALLLGVGAFLLATGRLGWAIAAVAGAVPWIMRAVRTHAMYRTLRGALGGRAGNRSQRSEVSTTYLRMTLEHDTGDMEGTVLAGSLAGRALSTLAMPEFVELWRECQAEPQSVQLLAAWADRVRPGWREAAEESVGGARQDAGGGTMSREEAYDVLGLGPGASDDAIRAAYRKLMAVVHPDRGGSTYLAARINQAKDVLLGSRG